MWLAALDKPSRLPSTSMRALQNLLVSLSPWWPADERDGGVAFVLLAGRSTRQQALAISQASVGRHLGWSWATGHEISLSLSLPVA